jgi:uncharacterized membrane protein
MKSSINLVQLNIINIQKYIINESINNISFQSNMTNIFTNVIDAVKAQFSHHCHHQEITILEKKFKILVNNEFQDDANLKVKAEL